MHRRRSDAEGKSHAMTPNTSEPHAGKGEQQESISIDLIRPEDVPEVLTLLKTFFFKDEPLNSFLKMDDCKELQEFTIKSIPENCSFKAVNAQGELIGVAINSLMRRPAPNQLPESYAEKCQNPKFKQILLLMEYIDSQFSIFDEIPDVNVVLDGKVWSVSDKYRGCGIAGRLTNRTIQYMRENQVPMMHVMCSSHYSARVLEKMNFEEVYRLPYSQYLINGKQALKPAEPHVAARILIKRV